MYVLPEDGLWTETCCKQISHIHNKQPLVVIDNIFLYLCYHHKGMNQFKMEEHMLL